MHFDYHVTSCIPIPKDILNIQEILNEHITNYLLLNKEFYNMATYNSELPTHAKGDGMGFMGQSSF